MQRPFVGKKMKKGLDIFPAACYSFLVKQSRTAVLTSIALEEVNNSAFHGRSGIRGRVCSDGDSAARFLIF